MSPIFPLLFSPRQLRAYIGAAEGTTAIGNYCLPPVLISFVFRSRAEAIKFQNTYACRSRLLLFFLINFLAAFFFFFFSIRFHATHSRLVTSGIPMFVKWLNGVTARFRGTRNTRAHAIQERAACIHAHLNMLYAFIHYYYYYRSNFYTIFTGPHGVLHNEPLRGRVRRCAVKSENFLNCFRPSSDD